MTCPAKYVKERKIAEKKKKVFAVFPENFAKFPQKCA